MEKKPERRATHQQSNNNNDKNYMEKNQRNIVGAIAKREEHEAGEWRRKQNHKTTRNAAFINNTKHSKNKYDKRMK